MEGIKKRHLASKHRTKSQMLLTVGDYEGALYENLIILAIVDGGYPGNEAVFNIALTYAHHNNPKKDFSKSLEYFHELIENYPQSPLLEQARIWISVLEDIEKSEVKLKKKENNRLTSNVHLLRGQNFLLSGDYEKALKESQRILKMSAKSPLKDRALYNIGLVYAHYDNPDKDYKKSLGFFTKLIKEHPDSPLLGQARIWQSVLNVIEEAKQVDIEIEEKKKELQR
jgi:tetratricopeptide (TPR) repeat protein